MTNSSTHLSSLSTNRSTSPDAKVLIVNTGGTFGMVEGASGLQPASGLAMRINAVVPDLPVQFDLVDLVPLIDSSNLMPSQWQAIAQLILEQGGDYSGIVVIHGTDTMAYTASALSFICASLGKPIVVTGSQKPLEHPASDAPSNLSDSIELCLQASGSGIYLCFGGYILQGNRARKVAVQSYQGFDSPNYPRLGLTQPSLILVQSAAAYTGPLVDQVPVFSDRRVASLLIYPGLPAGVVEAIAESGADAIILLSYGSGNLPSADHELMNALKQAHAAGVLLVNLSQCPIGHVEQGVYAAGSLLKELGALEGYDLTPEAAFARMHFLLACCDNKKAVVTAWSQPLCGEFSLL